jgi:hypothetical protein
MDDHLAVVGPFRNNLKICNLETAKIRTISAAMGCLRSRIDAG